MKPGSVVVDLAGETGGNCELTEPGETVVRHGVTIASPLNLPATMPEHASELYAQEHHRAAGAMLITDGELAPDFRRRDPRRVLRDPQRGTSDGGMYDTNCWPTSRSWCWPGSSASP